MAHRNDAIIVGRVGTNVKFKKAKSGSDYISFSIRLKPNPLQGNTITTTTR